VIVIVLAATFWDPLAGVLRSRPFRWLGMISFSLYLVHEPIVVALAFLTHGSKWGTVAAFALSIVAGYLFWRSVERPTHALARSLATAQPASR
jgi:peptidoglycan/LPS O-acetylase OafA/YrhL